MAGGALRESARQVPPSSTPTSEQPSTLAPSTAPDTPSVAAALTSEATAQATSGDSLRIEHSTVNPEQRSWRNTLNGKKVTLRMNGVPLKEVLDEITLQTGINFVLDETVDPRHLTTVMGLEFPLDTALEIVVMQNRLARQVVAAGTVVLYPNTMNKQREYQQQMIKTFQLTNIDPNKAADMLRMMLNARTIYVDIPSWSIMVRDTPELIDMAERLLATIDLPDAEVMMEVEVLEVSKDRIEQLGIRYPDSFTVTPSPLVGDTLVLGDLRYQNSTTWKLSNIAASAEFKRTLSSSNILASPRIRARNHEKARILIGQRVPVITNTVTPTNTVPVVTGSVQYVDVGLTLEVEPTIYRDNDVAIRVNLEVSSIIKEVLSAVSGTLAYQMGSRMASTMLRLKDGETQILAGLINDEERRTADRLPGLGGLPLIGRLFGTKKKDGGKTEIILSITPHIIRPQARSSEDAIRFWYGTENSLSSANPSVAPEVAREPTPEVRPLVNDVVGTRGAYGVAPRGADGAVPRGADGVAPRGANGMPPRGSNGVAPRGSNGVAPRGAYGVPPGAVFLPQNTPP